MKITMTDRRGGRRAAAVLLAALLALAVSLAAFAGDQSDDNSLSSLGITTDGVTVSPDFSYDHLNYDVVVPAGTATLELSPVLSNPDATVNSIEGTELQDGAGTVTITVTAPSGAMTAYTLNVTSAPDTSASAAVSVDPAQAVSENEAKQTETASETEKVTEPVTEDSRYVKVDRNTLADAEKTISDLQSDLEVYKERAHVFSYVIYALIAICIVLLFLMINLLLKTKDTNQRLKEYQKAHSGMQEADDSGDIIPEDGWLDDDIDETAPKKKKKSRRKDTPRYDDQPSDSMLRETGQPGYRRAQTPWTEQQVGTPMEMPRETVPYDGYASRSRKAAGSVPQRDRDDTKLYRTPPAAEGRDSRVPGGETRVLPVKEVGGELQGSARQMTRAEAKAAAKASKDAAKASKEAAKAQKAAEKEAAKAQKAVPASYEAAEDRLGQPAEERRGSMGSPAGKPEEKDVRVDMIDL